MPEEGSMAPEETQDTQTEAPEQVEGTPSEETQPQESTDNWQERYANLQPEYTRATQEAAELRQEMEQVQLAQSWLQSDDPDQRRQAQEFFGLEVEDDGFQPDELEQLRQEVNTLKSQTEAQQEEAFYNQLGSQIDDAIDEIAKDNNATLHPMVKEQIFTRAVALDPDEQGNLQVEQAYKDVMEEMRKAFVEDYVASKKAPRVAPSGKGGSAKLDTNDPQSRIDRMAAVAEANSE